MKILLINPRFPDTYWSFRHALKFISKKGSNPPLGLLTIAAMLPAGWHKKLVDLNVGRMAERDIQWADLVFISAMSVQSASVAALVQQCKKWGKRIVAGGPLFSSDPEPYAHIDHLILNEAELTLPPFLHDLADGKPQRIYQSADFASLEETPPPDYSLIKASDYAQLSIQYSRGCPYNCEFCEITALLGHRVRVKTTGQVLVELENIYLTGFRGNVFFVDDNFIGNRTALKHSLLPAITAWLRAHKYPFTFTTEASINLADDPDLMKAMVQAGFEKVFVGIETVDAESLKECNKHVNLKHDLMKSVRIIQSAGIEVSAGFIVGFDHDSSSIFQRQIEFIQSSNIITAMVGLLNAPSQTRLHQRLKEEGRIIHSSDGDNTNFSINFIPKMDMDELLKGYRSILSSIYSRKAYHRRLKSFLKSFNPGPRGRLGLSPARIGALLRSMVFIGILEKGRRYYWDLFLWSLLTRPKLFPLAITYSIYGYHFRKFYRIDT